MIAGETRSWDYYIPTVQLAINNKIATLTNSTPFALMFARRLNAFDSYSQVQPSTSTERSNNEELLKRIRDMKDIVMPAIVQRTTDVRSLKQQKFNATHKIVDYPIGTLVGLMKPIQPNQMEAKYNGPFTIVKKNRGGAYVLQQRNGELLPKAYPPSALKHLSDENDPDSQDRWEVQAIIDHRGSAGKYEYKVRWKGYTADDDTWETADMFDDNDTITTYWHKRNLTSKRQNESVKRRKRTL
ncbi:hypothetical protein [Absidia glauca]|uniref:Chromo domain-containing protein n=1 Tax=Absidia glauca TaxID=4829 RepID=A0A168LJN4_ABSGL|nr:hypothetical protein [Absidia glauca]